MPFGVWLLMDVKVVRVVGDGVAVVVRPDSVRRVVAHGVVAAQIVARVWRSGVACLIMA